MKILFFLCVCVLLLLLLLLLSLGCGELRKKGVNSPAGFGSLPPATQPMKNSHVSPDLKVVEGIDKSRDGRKIIRRSDIKVGCWGS